MSRRLIQLTLSLMLLSSPAALLRADDVLLELNEQMLDAIRLSRTPPPQASYALAVYHAAIYDAVNGIAPTHTPYQVSEGAPAGADPTAAALSAANTVFMSHMAGKANPRPFQLFYKEALSAVPESAAKAKGVEWGKTVAQLILKARENDGRMNKVEPVIGDKPGVWRPTPPLFRSPTDPHWAHLKPFTMKRNDQFRPAPPPALESREFADAVNEVKRLGARESDERTEYETNSTIFWSDDLGTATPPGHWNVVAQDLSRRYGFSLQENARLFALLNLAAADAGISCWEAKYHYNFWRPEHAIREADSYDNPLVEADPEFIPLMTSPTFPDYTSGHSTFSRACTQLLTRYFGTDEISFTTVSEGLPGDVRQFNSFSEAAKEVGRSRIFGGIHYSFADVNAQKSGEALANYVFENFLLPIESIATR